MVPVPVCEIDPVPEMTPVELTVPVPFTVTAFAPRATVPPSVSEPAELFWTWMALSSDRFELIVWLADPWVWVRKMPAGRRPRSR